MVTLHNAPSPVSILEKVSKGEISKMPRFKTALSMITPTTRHKKQV
jgi:hypothetical protein